MNCKITIQVSFSTFRSFFLLLLFFYKHSRYWIEEHERSLEWAACIRVRMWEILDTDWHNPILCFWLISGRERYQYQRHPQHFLTFHTLHQYKTLLLSFLYTAWKPPQIFFSFSLWMEWRWTTLIKSGLQGSVQSPFYAACKSQYLSSRLKWSKVPDNGWQGNFQPSVVVLGSPFYTARKRDQFYTF